MKKVVFFLALIAVAVVGQSAFGQTAQEKSQMTLVEREISRLENELRDMEKIEGRRNAEDKLKLRIKIRELQWQADPSRAKTEEQMLWAKAELNNLQLQIDSIDSLAESNEISYKRQEIRRYQDERQKMLSRWTAPNNSIPREMTVLVKNRRQRANTVRREELVLTKIENNLEGSQIIKPLAQGTGYQIILDNKSPHLVTFMLRGMKGGEEVSFTLSPRTKERHSVLPDVYFVEFVVSGRKVQSQQTNLLTIDGQVKYYEGEPTFGYAYKAVW